MRAKGGRHMSTWKHLSRVFESAEIIPFHSSSRFVIMSDCHRGDGSWSDNFLKNQTIFFAALSYYYNCGFSYIELGDGDELWENRNMNQIINVHSDAFWLMSRFHLENRLFMIYGNHDMVKKNYKFISNKCSTYYCEGARKEQSLFPNMQVHEGLILENKEADIRLYLAHGHQGDILNDTLWPLTRFLVRYLWHPLELVGVLDPTSAAKNYGVKSKTEKRLIKWVEKEHKILITGHTHRPVFPTISEPTYFNDGSCIHPRCITAIEIDNDNIILVKWTTVTNCERILYIAREVLAGPTPLTFLSHKNQTDSTGA